MKVVGRPDETTRELIFRDRVLFVSESRRLAASLALIYLFTAGVVLWIVRTGGPWLFAFFLGGLTVGWGWLVTYFLDMDNSQSRRRGGWAEDWTSTAIKKAFKSEGTDWTLFNDVSFEHYNVDHVLVGPKGIFVFETKWQGNGRRRTFTARALRGPIAQTRQSCEEIENLLGSDGFHPSIRGVLAVWGPGSPQLDRGQGHIAKTVVLVGATADWRGLTYWGEPLDAVTVKTISETLMRYLNAQTSNRRHSPRKALRLLTALARSS